MVQEVLADPKWADKFTNADRRALSPLFWTDVNPYGRFELDMNSRLDPDLSIRAGSPARAPRRGGSRDPSMTPGLPSLAGAVVFLGRGREGLRIAAPPVGRCRPVAAQQPDVVR